jgi:hypothetical protein
MKIALVTALVGCLLAAASTARADREIGHMITLSADISAHGRSFDDAGNSNGSNDSWHAGLRFALAFEQPLAIPREPMHQNFDLRLTPELLAGLLVDDTLAEGYIGAGVRGELAVAGRRDATHTAKLITYIPVRALLMSSHHDPGIETGLGQFFVLRTGRRIGYEVSVIFRERHDAPPADSHELHGLFSLLAGW